MEMIVPSYTIWVNTRHKVTIFVTLPIATIRRYGSPTVASIRRVSERL